MTVFEQAIGFSLDKLHSNTTDYAEIFWIIRPDQTSY